MARARQFVNPKFPHFIHGCDWNPDQWLQTPAVIEEDFRMMKLAGVNSASVAIFAWAKLEPEEGRYDFSWLDPIMDRAAKEQMAIVLATPSGARPAWMAQKYPEVLRVRPDGIRNLFGDRHNHCFTSPVYREKTFSMDRKLAEHYKGHQALFLWHLSNEYSGECYCELCRSAFRDWLKKRYGNSLEKLNQQWWTDFWSHTYTDWEQINPPVERGENCVHGLTLDWRRFATHQTADFMSMEYRAVKEITPDVPATTNLMGTFPWLDYWELARRLDIVSWDMYPSWGKSGETEADEAVYNGFANDITRTLKNRPFLLMESTPSATNWQEASKLKRPGVHLLSSLMAVAHGADSVQYFQWRKSRGSAEKFHGAVVDHCGHEHTRVFRDVAEVGDALPKIGEVCGSSHPSEVAVIYDWENGWAIESMAGIVQRHRRRYDAICAGHYGAFWNLGVNVDVPESLSDLSGYKIVVAPMLYMLKPGVAERIRVFVENGGTFVATYMTGITNENDLCFLGGMPGDDLRKVFGLTVEETDGLYPRDRNTLAPVKGNCLDLKHPFKITDICDLIQPEGCETVAVYGSDFYAGRPCLTVNRYGKGEAWYIAARTSGEFLNPFYDALTARAGIKRNLVTTLPPGVTVQKRTHDGQDWLFLMNFNHTESIVSIPSGQVFQDMLSGARISSKVKLKPYACLVLKK
jgi:beta-galactosidase